jgi:hypothetical protein
LDAPAGTTRLRESAVSALHRQMQVLQNLLA